MSTSPASLPGASVAAAATSIRIAVVTLSTTVHNGSMTAASACVWPPTPRPWPLRSLSEVQWQFWEVNGYVAIPDAVPASLVRAAARAIREYVGADDRNRSTWYDNTLDIYADVDADGKKPHHGRAGMVQMFHHASLWAIRQAPNLHAIFSDMWGTEALYVTCDRAHFKPPRDSAYPAWNNPGDVHVGVHWDVDTRRSAWPVPYTMQGVLYLEDTPASQGALRVVPGFHRRLAEWSDSQPSNRSAERPEGAALEQLNASAVSVAGAAGTLVLWHSAIPHGPGANFGPSPRVSAYVTMHPADATPYVGDGRDAESALGMPDAGTLAYLEDMQKLVLRDGDDGEPSCAEEEVEVKAGAPRAAADGRSRRQSRERRVERWRRRLPLLDEDPTEGELARRPPGEGEDAGPAALTPLGERLVGLVPWS